MYSIVGEDKSDVETIDALIRQLANDPKINIKTKGYSGAGEMFKKAATQLNVYSQLGCSKFVICYDSDNEDPEVRKQRIIEKIVKPSKVAGKFCALVPVQELEAWILADLDCVTKIFKGWRNTVDIPHPENIQNPKEYLIRLSKCGNQRPRYSNALHNPRLAEHLDLVTVEKKCPSFKPLADFVRKGKSNVKY